MNSMYMYLFLQNQFKWILDKSRPGGSHAVTHERLVLKPEKTDPVNRLPEISFHRFAMRQLLRSPSHYNTESYGKSRTKYLISDCILGGSCRMEYTGVFLTAYSDTSSIDQRSAWRVTVISGFELQVQH